MRRNSKSSFYRTASLLASLAVLASAATANAQSQVGSMGSVPEQDEGADSEALQTDPIVITGSRIATPGLTSVSPVATLGSEEIALDRSINIESVLGELPQFTASFGGASNGADARGAATADLRGLGQNRTLVLINGTRGAPFGFRNSVDLNSIPAPLVERVEVLTGGAAAIYGADAVAGVVNFILKSDFEGVEANAIYNITEEGDGDEYGVNLTFGTNVGDGRGNISGYLGYNNRSPVFKSDRAFAAPERNDDGPITTRPLGGTFSLADASENAAPFDFSAFGGPADATAFGFEDDGSLVPGATSSVLSGRESLIIAQERLNAAVFFDYELSDAVELYGRGTYTRTESVDVLPPVNISTTFLLRRDNPFLSDQLGTVLDGAFNRDADGNLGGDEAALLRVQRSIGEFGDRETETVRNQGQAQLGVRGDLGSNIRYDFYAQYGVTDSTSTIYGEGVASRFSQGIAATVDAAGNPVCIDASGGCVPIDIFGPNAISQQAVDYVTSEITQTRRREQFVSAFTLSGDTESFLTLPAGPVSWAAGVEYRDEEGTNNYDGLNQTGQTFNQGTRANFGGSIDVWDYFGEVRVPLLADIPFIQELNFEGAYRYSDYSTTGGVDAYKLGGDWVPVNGLRVRGAYQRVVRSPNIGELYGATAGIPLAAFANDPCQNPAESGADPELCIATGAPAAPYEQDLAGAQFLYGGSADIVPEVGNTYTVGAVLTPGFLPGFTATVDYYNIEIDNAIGAVLPQATLDTCYIIVQDIDNQFCNRISRGPNGQLTAVDSSDINVAQLSVEGIDVVAGYRLALGGETFESIGFNYAGNIVLDAKQQNGAAAPVIDCDGRFGGTCGLEFARAVPKYRHRVTTTLGLPDVDIRGTWRLEGAVRDDSPTEFLVERFGPQHYFDLAASFDVAPAMTVIAGIENLFDNKPPTAGSNASNANTFPTSYDVLGRRFGISVTLRN